MVEVSAARVSRAAFEDADDWAALDVAAISETVKRRALAACPDQRHLVKRLLERLQPDRWTLEWYLPWWLGQSLGVDLDTTREVVLSNVLGLGSLRLEDDLLDGEISARDQAGTRALSAALYAAAIAIYRARFEPESPFWDVLERSMSQWRAATGDHAPRRTGSRADEEAQQPIALARRGAPLKVCASALCLIAGRTEIVHRLHTAIDHALTAWVLYDDANDWEADLSAGRRNAFVAHLTREVAPVSGPHGPHDTVLLAMLATDALQRYFVAIGRSADRAAAASQALGLSPLSAHLRLFAATTGRRGARLQTHYHALTERATVLLFGDA